ncbi:MAG TPA: peptidylprolyl isomerase [Candidatus Hydrogenedentes bacterium]|nr:peptidylprolyl isomerase [Candidatus Hydrogenedentota bacterium]HOL75575.1 peptidylprolyl isomerase [Candidatus Hydrogenedentota bacterium]HPO87001.1 peptidylprolyl isomerase [Candidatus Hydrogenedentota bacterium]
MFYRQIVFGLSILAMLLTGHSWGEEQAAQVPTTNASATEAIVARVGDEVITQKEFEDTLKALGHMPDQPGGDAAFKDQILDQMVKTEILYVLAKQAKITVSDEEVQKEIENATQHAPSPDAFEKYLQSRGITKEQFAETVKKKMITQRFVEEKTKDIDVTEEEITAEFNRAKEAGQLDVADVSHILAQVRDATPEADANAKKKIEAARERITKGEDFAAVAKEVSEDPGSAQNGGEYTKVGRGVMVPEFDRLLFELPIGEVSQPFRTQFGWHIMKVSNRGTLTLEEIHDKAKEVLLRKKKIEQLEELIDKSKDTVPVEILLKSEEAPAGVPSPQEPGSEPAKTNDASI